MIDGLVLVYDITDLQSFKQISLWASDADRSHPSSVTLQFNRNSRESLKKVLVGNKSDLIDQRAVTTEEGKVKIYATSFPHRLNPPT
jgi:Ras-related protein Rab-1A